MNPDTQENINTDISDQQDVAHPNLSRQEQNTEIAQPQTVTAPIIQQNPEASSSISGQQNEDLIGKQKVSVEWYRRYWIFALIFLILPAGILFGIIILATGTVYKKKSVDNLYYKISNKEKIALLVIAILLQSFAFLGR